MITSTSVGGSGNAVLQKFVESHGANVVLRPLLYMQEDLNLVQTKQPGTWGGTRQLPSDRWVPGAH